MTTDRDTTRIVRSWLSENEHESADRVLDAVLDRLDTTPQRRVNAWPVRRLPHMNNTIRLALGAVAAVAVALFGYAYIVAPNVGAPSFDNPTPSPSASPPEAITGTDVGQPLSAGRYSISAPFHESFDLDLPAGWIPQALSVGEVSFTGPDGSYPYIGFFFVDGGYIDPCHLEAGSWGVSLSRPDPASLEDRLTSMVGFDAGPVSTTTVAGRPARHFVLSNDIDTETAGCTDGQMLPLFDVIPDKPVSTNGGTSQMVWIIDAGWSDPLLVVGETGVATADADEAAIESVLSTLIYRNASPSP